MNESERDIVTKIAVGDNDNNVLRNIVSKHIEEVIDKYKALIKNKIAKYIAAWVLEKDLWINVEESSLPVETDTLSRGRAVMVNPGVTGIGREQKYPHVYIVLGEFKETFIGVPITNMAWNKEAKKHYLRNYYEVELKNPQFDKPFEQFRCKKPSVADIRNISGLDKRRIIKNQLFIDKKFVPKEYLNAISDKIIESLAYKSNEEEQKDIDVINK